MIVNSRKKKNGTKNCSSFSIITELQGTNK